MATIVTITAAATITAIILTVIGSTFIIMSSEEMRLPFTQVTGTVWITKRVLFQSFSLDNGL